MVIMFNRGALFVRLQEMAAEYIESAERLDRQIQRLTIQISNEPDYLRAQLLVSQRQELYLVRRDCRELAAYLVNYYVKNQKTCGYSSTGCIKGINSYRRTRKGEQIHCAGIDGEATVLSDGVFQREEIRTDSEGE